MIKKSVEGFKTILASGERGQQVRALAGFLFEYTMPGLRRVPFRPQQTPLSPMAKSSNYQSATTLFKRFQKTYNHDPAFETYTQTFHGAPLEQTPQRRRPSIHFVSDEIVSPRDVRFWELMPEFRCSQMVFDWMHIGRTSLRFANARKKEAALFWIVADDQARRDCLKDIEKPVLLNELTKRAYGQDYEMRIRKRLKKITWQCEQPLQVPEKRYQMRQQERFEKLGFEISKEEANYMLDLYRLPRRL